MVTEQLALIASTSFAAAAFYISAVEQPARLQLDDHSSLVQWKPAYARGAVMQASLALAGFLLGLAAWWQTGDWLWIAGAVVLVAAWPYTLLVIAPTNNALKATAPAKAGPHTRKLLERWGALHAVRSAGGGVATVLFLIASLR